MAVGRALLLHSVLGYYVFAVTIIPMTLNLPKPYESVVKPAASPYDLLYGIDAQLAPSVTGEKRPQQGIEVSSYNSSVLMLQAGDIYAAQDSLVRGAIDAAARRQHLVFRPEDVWLTVLTQMSFYMRKHKDEKLLRDMWDSLDSSPPPVNIGWVYMMASRMDAFMEAVFIKRNKTDWLRNWVRLGFKSAPKPSNGTLGLGDEMIKAEDEMIAAALLLTRSTPSFEDIAPFVCDNGIPSITLLGVQAEWKGLLEKFDPMEKGQFGAEPQLHALNLRPILTRFIATFENPNERSIRLFWSDIVTVTPRQQLCNTTDIVTGWINAFHFWDGAGNLARAIAATANQTVQLDGVVYPWRNTFDLPISYVSEVCFGNHWGPQVKDKGIGRFGKSEISGCSYSASVLECLVVLGANPSLTVLIILLLWLAPFQAL